MIDMAEDFRSWDEAKREKKADNLAKSTALLSDRGIEFESKNNGVHLIVRGTGKVVDFWPSTGKFIVRGGRTGRGVFNLLRIIKPKATP